MSVSINQNEQIPAGWAWAVLEEVVIPAEKVKPEEVFHDTFQYIDIASVDNQKYEVREGAIYAVTEAPSRARQLVRTGDILFSTVRPYLKNIGRVPGSLDGQIASTGFCVLRPREGLDSQYLLFQCITNDFVARLEPLQRGSSYPAVRDRDIKGQSILLPPLKEQRRIVAKIEELFSELDSGVESLKTAHAQLQTYRQSLLKAAFEGLLTEKWRRENAEKLETADQLLLRIREERKARYQEALEKWKAAVSKWEEDGRRGRKPRKPSPLKFGEAPNETDESILPEGWGVGKISDVADVGTGVTPLKKRSDYYDGGTIPWVTSTAVNQEYIREPSAYVTETALSETNLRLYPKGTLLVAMYGEGKTRGKASELAIEATTNQALAAIRCEGIAAQLKAYLKWFLVYNYDQVRDSSSGGVQPNLNLGIVENTEFPVCSLEEQKEIVDRLESAFARTNELERVIESSLNQSDAMRQSILKRAFEGKLVPQDPNDEPASVLLERIRQDQTARPAPTKNRRRKQEVTAELFDDQS